MGAVRGCAGAQRGFGRGQRVGAGALFGGQGGYNVGLCKGAARGCAAAERGAALRARRATLGAAQSRARAQL